MELENRRCDGCGSITNTIVLVFTDDKTDTVVCLCDRCVEVKLDFSLVEQHDTE